jgi:outer membrane protein
MNRYSALACLGLGLMVSPLLGRFAESAVPASPKIGVIDMDKVLSETAAGKRANEKFEKTRKTKQAELDDKQKELQKAAGDLEKQALALKPDVLKGKQESLQKQFVELQQHYVKLEKDLAAERTTLIQTLLRQASPLISEIAKAEGVNVIFDQNAVVWIDPAVDLTEKLNAKMK